MNREQSLEKAINESVQLSGYDTEWPKIFTVECRSLMALCGDQLLAVEHIGSTAVPGLYAKPIIDIMGGVESMAIADKLLVPMCKSGYLTSAEFNEKLGNKRWLMRCAEGRRTHHLHLIMYGSIEWSKQLLFRDSLRSNLLLASKYEEHEKELAAQFENDREAYTEGKGDFIRNVIAKGAT